MILNIALIEPQIPQNTGNIARTCAATGARLHLVEPMGFSIDDKKLKRSGLDYWHYLDITTYSSKEDFFYKNKDKKMFFYTTKALNVYTELDYSDDCFLVFGREDKGIDEEILLKNKQSCARIPMGEGIRSLNLSNSVAIATYEVLRKWNFTNLENYGQLHKYKWNLN